MIYALVLINLLCVVACHLIAKSRGVTPVFWGLMGAMFGPLALPFCLMAKPHQQNQN